VADFHTLLDTGVELSYNINVVCICQFRFQPDKFLSVVTPQPSAIMEKVFEGYRGKIIGTYLLLNGVNIVACAAAAFWMYSKLTLYLQYPVKQPPCRS
jgi:hypothetical protein